MACFVKLQDKVVFCVSYNVNSACACKINIKKKKISYLEFINFSLGTGGVVGQNLQLKRQ